MVDPICETFYKLVVLYVVYPLKVTTDASVKLSEKLWHRCFFCEICKIFRNFFCRKTLVAASQ